MVLSNSEIVNALSAGHFAINDLLALDPSQPPFNTSAVDLRLSDELVRPQDFMGQLDLSKKMPGGIARHWQTHSTTFKLTKDQSYSLHPNQFVFRQHRGNGGFFS